MSKILKRWFVKNWMAKIVSLLLAIALWFLINEHLNSKVDGSFFLRSTDNGENTIEL